jgi:DNA-binding MarR family transcriptional regulator
MNEFLDLFTRAHKLLRNAADDSMSRYGVRVGQNLVLEVLWRNDGLTPGKLAAALRVSTPTVVKSATRMEAAGLLTRRRDAEDARLVRLYLTDYARSIQGAIERERRELELRATATLTDEERQHLLRALGKVIRELAPEDGNR